MNSFKQSLDFTGTTLPTPLLAQAHIEHENAAAIEVLNVLLL